MIFIIFNIAFFIILTAFSFTVKTTNENEVTASRLVNLILFLSALFAMTALTLILCKWAAPQFALMIGKITFALTGWFIVACCDYIIVFPHYKKNTFMYIVQWILNIFAVYMLFVRHGIDLISMADDKFVISSGHLWQNRNLLTIFQSYCLIYFVIIPLFTVIMVLVRAENEKSLLLRQRLIKNALSVVSAWAVFVYIIYGSNYQPMLKSIYLVGFVPMVMIFMNSSNSEIILDTRTLTRLTARFGIRYILPGVSCAYVYAVLWPKLYDHVFLFEFIYVGLAAASAVLIFSIRRLSIKTNILRDIRYADIMTGEVKAINLEDADPKNINDTLYKIFSKYQDTSSLNVLGDVGDGTLSTIYSTDNREVSIMLDDENFEKLLALHRHVFLRQYIQKEYSLMDSKDSILKIMDDNNSDAFILLNEGRHIIGIIFLGKKTTSNLYSDYDKDTLEDLYSDFFVIGYYQKNIANQDIVGTVNRELQMSSQIITSIQENMDFIKNPKIDAGYIMVPAHSIGGEFIDFIRLDDYHHIFIIGSLSGKGIAASMNMVILKSVIRTFLNDTRDFKDLIQKINYFICTGLPKGTLFAGTIGLLDFITNTMFYVNCGSAGIFYYTRSFNNVIEIQGQGHILGFRKDIKDLIKVRDVRLSPGDIILSCTDGLLDSKSLRGESYGKERIQKQMIENVSFDSSKTAKFIYNNLVSFSSKELEDDITILVFKYLGETK